MSQAALDFRDRSLLRFMVETGEGETGEWKELGSICLANHAPRHECEHALSAVGIYAPRGHDMLEWFDRPEGIFAMIYDAGGHPTVRLTAYPRRRR